jgi:3-hydroxyisobutyrate dehydrogenase-like beta-hydroxyacid dehydrogenase
MSIEALEIAVIGLGAMGGGIANRLLDVGAKLTVYNRTQAATAQFVARGARAAATPAEAVKPGGIAITMVANDAALEQVTMGADGLLQGLGAGGVHISMSTISPTCATQLAARHQEAGSDWVSSPVFGRGDVAAKGQLWLAVSGGEAAKARVQPALEALGRGRTDFGSAPGAAPLAKIAGNFMILAATEMMGEAFALLQKNNVDARGFHDMITQSLFAAPIYKTYGPLILDRNFSPPGFRLVLGAKDIGLAIAAAIESQTPMPLASLVRDRLLAAMANGLGEQDVTAMTLQAAADAGLNR